MQRGAARCNGLQRIAVCGGVLQSVAVCCSLLQSVAVCCSVLHCVAVCCSEQSPASLSSFTLHLVALTYSVLQFVKA